MPDWILMRKLKKSAKIPSRKLNEGEDRRSRIILTAIIAGSFLMVLAIIYGYMSLTSWLTERSIVRGISSENEDEQVSAIRTIVIGKHQQHLPSVCAMLAGDASVKVREEALKGIRQSNFREGVPAVVHALGDTNKALSEEALKVLSMLARENIAWENVLDWWEKNQQLFAGAPAATDDVPVVSGLEKMLKSTDKYERKEAVERLEKLRHWKARDALAAAAADPDADVRAAAERALGAIRTRPSEAAN